MPPIEQAVVLLILFAALWGLLIAVIAHALTRRYWLACAVVTGLILLGCVGLHIVERYRDALSIAMLYGIGGAAGLGLSAVGGLSVLVVRRLRR